MSRHGRNCQKKARANARLKRNWLKRYGSLGRRRWNTPPASSIIAQNKRTYEIYGNAGRK